MESKSPGSKILICVVIGAFAVAIWFVTRPRQPAPAAPAPVTVAPAPAVQPAAAVAPVAPATKIVQTAQAVPARPAPTNATVTIQDGKTIDFSSGKAVVRDTAGEKAIIDAAVKEMEAAAKEVTFGPTPKN